MKARTVSTLFLVAALYDGLLGLAFLVATDRIFQLAQVTLPNHVGYVQFPAALLVIFAIMFATVAWRPRENRNLIPYGVLLKLSYCGVAGYHWLMSGIPAMWKPFVVIDLVFLVLFLVAYGSLGNPGQGAAAGARTP
jgi:hypothetical protein